jgi:redox-sensitive bicupin YhaK (pirin superfamily)
MIRKRADKDRGKANIDWLDGRHSFSFGHYYDTEHMGFKSLRVINEDKFAAAKGFPTHPHKDMEIISYILTGSLEHKDSVGNGSTIKPGVVQRMTAGTGIKHSEFNPSDETQNHFFQIWIEPDQNDLEPSWEEKTFDEEAKRDTLLLVASKEGRDGSLSLNQDLDLYATRLAAGKSISHNLVDGRDAWLQVAEGSVTIGDVTLDAGDGASLSEEDRFTLTAQEDAHVLVFDIA